MAVILPVNSSFQIEILEIFKVRVPLPYVESRFATNSDMFSPCIFILQVTSRNVYIFQVRDSF